MFTNIKGAVYFCSWVLQTKLGDPGENVSIRLVIKPCNLQTTRHTAN